MRTAVALVAAAGLLGAASCGDGAPAVVESSTGEPASAPAEATSAPTRIRFALAPDPVWEWLESSGNVAAAEQRHNIRIEASSPFDQFAAFAGGHADAVVVNALEVPQFVEQSGREPVIVGKLNRDRSFIAVKRGTRAEALPDIVESAVAVDNSLGQTMIWGLIADELHQLDFRDGSSDFNLVVVESASVADLLTRGDTEACVCVPDFSAAESAERLLLSLYGGRSAAEVYAQEVLAEPDAVPVADVIVVDGQWFARNRDAIGGLLALWQTGLDHWATNKASLVADYRHMFSAESDAETAWISDYVTQHDWMLPSVYLTVDDAAIYADMFARMLRIGLVSADAARPEMDLSFSSES